MRRKENRKTPRARRVNQQQTEPTYMILVLRIKPEIGGWWHTHHSATHPPAITTLLPKPLSLPAEVYCIIVLTV